MLWWSKRRKRIVCPTCGSRDVLSIVYGLPTDEALRRAGRGELALGGCIIDDHSPVWHCRKCGAAWGGPVEGEEMRTPRR